MDLYLHKKLVWRGHHPELIEVINTGGWSLPELEFDSDGSIHDYWSLDEISTLCEEYKSGMILYCSTGKSRFCLDYRSGYYKVFDSHSEWISRNLFGDCQEDFERAYKQKAFW